MADEPLPLWVALSRSMPSSPEMHLETFEKLRLRLIQDVAPDAELLERRRALYRVVWPWCDPLKAPMKAFRDGSANGVDVRAADDARQALRQFALSTATELTSFSERCESCFTAFVLSHGKDELVQVANVLFSAPSYDAPTLLTYELVRQQPADLWTSLADADVALGEKSLRLLESERGKMSRPVLSKILTKVGFLYALHQSAALAQTPLLGSSSFFDLWKQLLQTKTSTRAADIVSGKRDVWPRHIARRDYNLLRHYASVDRFLLRRRLWNVTTHAKVWNRDVIDTILEFVFGVFATEHNFFREKFKAP